MTEQIEEIKDIADGSNKGDWKYWDRELKNAIDYRKDFNKEVDEYCDIYENETEGAQYADERYPIFWANVQTLKPLIYSNLPLADIRKRYAAKDYITRMASILLERGANYFMETGGASMCFEQARDDALITGWGVVKVRFEAEILKNEEGEENVGEKSIKYDFIPYEDYLCSPAKIESLVRWRAYRHKMAKEELKEQFGSEIANKISLTASILEEADEDDEDIFKRAEVWEIWDKESGKVIFWSDGYKDGLLSREDSAYNLSTFFPSPSPINLGRINDTILPVPPYRMYKSQAEELNQVTDRITSIVGQIKAGGLYNKVLASKNVDDLLNNTDGKYDPVAFDPSMNIQNLIYTKDIVSLANVLQVLRTHKMELVNEVRDITGLSDIVRGTSVASETATAQRLKGNFAISRIQPQQQAMSNFIRDVIRITAELVAENWSGEELAQIANMQVLKQADFDRKILEVTTQQGLGIEEVKKVVQVMREEREKTAKLEMAITDSDLDEVERILKSDKLRGYNIDIESETTVKIDSDQLKSERIEFLNVMTAMVTQLAPMVQAGIFPIEAVKALIGFGARPFKVGRELEDAFDMIGQQPPEEEQKPQEPSEAMIDAQLKSRELDIKERQVVGDQKLKAVELKLNAHENENDRQSQFTLEELRAAAKQSGGVK